ncbi:Melibiose/raffinose/stachyose import permease protein MelD [subsurface metagenome]
MVLKALKRRRLTGYFFISPWIIGFVIFLLGPILYALYISFTNWDMLSLPRFIGLQNYLDLFSDNLFKHSLFVTMRFVLTIVSISMVLSLSLAMLLNSNSKVMYFFRTMFYIPSVISGIAMAILWSWVFSPDFGILNYALSLFKIQGPNWLGDPLYAPWAFVIMMLPVFVGAPMIIFIAGLQNIHTSLGRTVTLS